jgi:electron transfer flavoprotein beta subunit
MKIAVCVKHVPELHLRLDPASLRLDRTPDGELNKVDTNAIEAALRLKETSEAEVVAITMGPAVALESLHRALALGADRAIHVCDDGAVGSDLLATTNVLATVLGRESADLVLFGQQATDSGGAVLWSAIADRLGLPYVSQATELSLDGGRACVRRQTEYGYDIIEAPLPAIVAVSDAINEPRYPSLKGMMGAKRKPCETLTLADLGIEPAQAGAEGSRTLVRSASEPPTRGGTTKIEDEGGAAHAILDYLIERELV